MQWGVSGNPQTRRAPRLRARLPRSARHPLLARPAGRNLRAGPLGLRPRRGARCHDRPHRRAPGARRCRSRYADLYDEQAASASRAASRTCREPDTGADPRAARDRRRSLARQGDLLHQHVAAADRRPALPAPAPGRAHRGPTPRASNPHTRHTRSDGSQAALHGHQPKCFDLRIPAVPGDRRAGRLPADRQAQLDRASRAMPVLAASARSSPSRRSPSSSTWKSTATSRT